MVSKKLKSLGDLGSRICINGFSSLVVAAFIFFAEFPFFRIPFTALIAVIASVAIWEYYQLVAKKGLQPAVWLGISAVSLYVFAQFIKTQGPYPFFNPLWQNGPEIVVAFAFFASFATFAIKRQGPILNIATTFLGIVYIGIPLGLFVRIVYFFLFEGGSDPHFMGAYWLMFLLVVTKSADMGGYFIGRRFGKHKLISRLSPNKTIEGAIGGLFVAIGVAIALYYLTAWWHVPVSMIDAIWLGALIGVLGQMGDLAESLLKRDAKVKDSNALPAVGGLLDMVDSLLFTSPVVYIYLKMSFPI